MKKAFCVFVVFFLLKTAGALSEIKHTLKDSIIRVSYDTISLAVFLKPMSSDRTLFNESKIILRGDTIVERKNKSLFEQSVFKDDFPWSVIEYDESITYKYYLTSYDIRDAKVIKKVIIQHSYARSGEDLFPLYTRLFFLGLALAIISFLGARVVLKRNLTLRSVMGFLCIMILLAISSLFFVIPSFDTSVFLIVIYELQILVIYNLSKFFLKRYYTKKELCLQNV